jgi:hypothetical protein
MGAGGDDGSNAESGARVVNQRYGKRSANVKQSAPCRAQVLGEAVGVVGGVPALEVGQALHDASPPILARYVRAAQADASCGRSAVCRLRDVDDIS